MSTTSPPGEELANFENPPIVEVALGVQFRPILGLRPIELAPLRAQWESDFPIVQEQPPVPPTIEESATGGPSFQLMVGPALQTRLWFLDRDEAQLLQLQHDRFTVNWRRTDTGAPYPRYPSVRGVFQQRFEELESFLAVRELGRPLITQAELNYVNAVDVSVDELGALDRLLRFWQPVAEHHLGQPQEARIALAFEVPNLGQPPVRLYVSAEPARRPDGRPLVFLNLTLRGAPTDSTIDSGLEFLDEAHEHVVTTFLELTPEVTQVEWGRKS